MKTTGDLNQDGLIDLLVGGSKGPLVWYANPGWEKNIITEGGYNTVDGVVGDIDQDGDLDVVMGGFQWYENPLPDHAPNSSVWTAHRIADHPTHDVEIADLDGDGDLDLVTRDQSDFGHNAGNQIFVWIQENPDSWKSHAIACPHGEGITLADLDRDGDFDLVIGGLWFENTGKQDGKWPSHSFAEWHPSATVKTADINGDGRVDIILTPSELQGNVFKISWFEAPTDPHEIPWKEHIIEPKVECVYHSLDLADIDRDGDWDIITAEMHQGEDPDEVVLYMNAGKGQAWTKKILSEKGSHYIQGFDVDGDGDMDLFGANHGGPYSPVELWRNRLK